MTDISVLIVDDDLMVRTTLSHFLSASGLRVAGTCISGEEALEVLAIDDAIDVILMDIRMDGMSGITAARIIIERHARPRVVMLTSLGEVGATESARTAGTWGFLFKDVLPETIAAAIRAVAAGVDVMAHVPRERRGRYTEDVLKEAAKLSVRDRAVLGGLCAGKSNGTIGELTGTSESTAKSDIVSLQKRLGADNRIHLAIIAHDLGLDNAIVTPR